MLDSHIRQLEHELELDFSLKSELPGVYLLPLEEECTIAITEVPRGFELKAPLGAAPPLKAESFYEEAMHANLFGQGSEGAILAIDESGSRLLLTRHVEEELSYRDFSAIIEDFVNAADYWREEAKSQGDEKGGTIPA